MKMDNKEIVIIQSIQQKLKQGDIKKISNELGYSRSYVGKVFNTTYNFYNQDIVDAAMKLINEREEKCDSILKTLQVTQ